MKQWKKPHQINLIAGTPAAYIRIAARRHSSAKGKTTLALPFMARSCLQNMCTPSAIRRMHRSLVGVRVPETAAGSIESSAKRILPLT